MFERVDSNVDSMALPSMPPHRRRPRGHIEQLPSGKYRARVYAGRDPLTNKERYLLQTAPTYEAAQKAATQLIAAFEDVQKCPSGRQR